MLIQESSLSQNIDKLSKNLFCVECTNQCTFYKCKEKKVSIYEKRLACIAYELFNFLAKANFMFPEQVKIEIASDNSSVKTYSVHLQHIYAGFGRLTSKFDSFQRIFHEQMLKVYKQNKNKKAVMKRSNTKDKLKDKENEKRNSQKRLTKALMAEEREDKQSSHFPLNKDVKIIGENSQPNLSRDAEDEEKKSLNSREIGKVGTRGTRGGRVAINRMESVFNPKDSDGEEAPKKLEALEDSPDGGDENDEKKDIPFDSNGRPALDEEDKKSVNSAETMRLLLTADYGKSFSGGQENNNKDDQLRKGESEELREGEFNIVLIHDKFQQTKVSKVKSTLVGSQNSSPSGLGERSKGGSDEFRDLLSPKLAEAFRPKEIETLSKEYELYIKTLSDYKVKCALDFYSNSVRTLRLSIADSSHRDDPFEVIQKTIFYVSPHIFQYFSKDNEQKLISKLLKYPPRTRKIVILKEINLMMVDLFEYQKLYAFKELSWIVSVANMTQITNIVCIGLINVYTLVTVNLESRALNSSSALYILMIIGLCVSGVCSLFIPIEKLFLAKTYVSIFNSFKTRVEVDYQETLSSNIIIEDKQQFLYWYGCYISLVRFLHKIVHITCTKYLIALLHYDNLFQFSIFYLSLTGVSSKSLFGNYISLSLVLVKTSTIYKLYTYLQTSVVAVSVYLAFIFVLIFQLGVFYFLMFRVSLSNHNPGLDCDTIANCFAYAGNYGFFEFFGYTEAVAVPFKDDPEHLKRLISDTFTYTAVSFFTSLLILSSPLLTQ